MFILALLVIIGLLVYFDHRKNANNSTGFSITDQRTPQDINRDQLWNDYVESFTVVAKTEREKLLLATILRGGRPEDIGPIHAQKSVATAESELIEAKPAHTQASVEPITPVYKQPLDGTLLLLYFGAFLFVASAGLFVAFGGFSGAVRTLLVLLTTAVMYGGGFNLYSRNKRLEPAGIAFVAIGMAIAPLVGVAVYHYMASGLHPALIWLGTSVLCLAMYANALKKLQTTFISYLFIFSFISLFESAIAVVNGSVQYYIWSLILVGMGLRILRVFRESEDLKESSAISAQIIIPLSTLVSLYLVSARGVGQLSVSLLLAAIYYSMEAFRDRQNKPLFAAVSQVLYLVAIATGVFAISAHGLSVAIALMAAVAAQLAIICVLPARGEVSQNFASIAFISVMPSVLLAYPNGAAMSAALASIVAAGLVVAVKQTRVDAFGAGSFALIILPYVVGQSAILPHLNALQQTEISAVPVLALLTIKRWLHSKAAGSEWQVTGAVAYVGAGILCLAPVWGVGGWTGLVSTLIFATSVVWVASYTKLNFWWAASGAIVAVPIVSELGHIDGRVFSVAALAALFVNLIITLICRAEFNRWAVTILMLLVPIAFGAGGLGFKWSAVAYAYAYFMATLALILCRSIARGVLLASSKIPVVSFYRSASLSYVTGYIVAAAIAILVSLAASRSVVHTTVLLSLLLATTVLLSLKVEKNKEILGFIPIFAQAILASAIRPSTGIAASNAVIFASSSLALLSYGLAVNLRDYLGKSAEAVRGIAWGTIYIPILFGFFYEASAPAIPLALMAAGGLTLYHYWHHKQSEREVSGGVIVFALLWLLSSLGIHNLQADTHIIALTFGVYAYWRHTLGDRKNSDAYLYWMFGVATVPLVLQALGGRAGDLYGWWLLLEQVGFMILGISIKHRLLTMWGLYVAIGAVLYQLRHLGWAALSFLALFIIAIAIRRLLLATDHDKDAQ